MVGRVVRFSIVVVLVLAGYLSGGEVLASKDFGVTSRITYEVGEDGNAEVRQEVEIENLNTEKYLREFALEITGKGVGEVRAVGEGEEVLGVKQADEEGETKLMVNLPEVIGKGKEQRFALNYLLEGVVERQGDVWNLSLPKIDVATYDQLEVEVRIPGEFGNLAMVDPKPGQVIKNTQETVLEFEKRTVGQSGITAVFGQTQIYDLHLTYHLINQEKKPQIKQIALPPDTDFQRLFYHQINPPPANIQLDPDGNWLAIYQLPPGKQLTISIQAQAQVFSSPHPLPTTLYPDDLSPWLASQQFWEVDTLTIQKLAAHYLTPQKIYSGVIDTLNYDYNRVGSWESRQGALAALNHPQHSICSDYTDLFIALSRAAGIPARQAIGYAYSTHPSLQPLSLTKDILHTWPEYWDEKQKIWIPVDPTWGETTGGVDYFSRLDLNHLKFVSLGLDPENPPPPGTYKSPDSQAKDIQISFGTLSPPTPQPLQIKLSIPWAWPFGKLPSQLTISNPNPTAVYQQPFTLKPQHLDLDQTDYLIEILPPYGKKAFHLQLAPHKWTFHRSAILVNFSPPKSSQINLISLPLRLRLAQTSIITLGGLVSGFLLFKLAKFLQSIRKSF